MRIILDANLIAAIVLPLSYSAALKARLKEIGQESVTFTGPALWSYEVISVLRKFIVAGYLSADKANAVVNEIWELDIDLIPDSPDLQRRALVWAEKLGQSKAYDSAYLAVAEALGAEFWTADRELVRRAGVDWVRAIVA